MKRSSVAIWLAAFAIAAFPAYWITDTRQPIVPIGAVAQPDNAPPGASIKVFYRADVRRDDGECDVSIARTWVDAKGFTWPLIANGLPYDIGFKDIGFTMAVPMDAAKGPATLKSTLVWSCNPLQRVWSRSTALPDVAVQVLR